MNPGEWRRKRGFKIPESAAAPSPRPRPKKEKTHRRWECARAYPHEERVREWRESVSANPAKRRSKTRCDRREKMQFAFECAALHEVFPLGVSSNCGTRNSIEGSRRPQRSREF